MKKFILALGMMVVLSAGSVAFAHHMSGHGQYVPGPEERHPGHGGHYDRWNGSWKGFCYSQRRQICSSGIFERSSEQEIAQACSNTGWHRYYAFRHGYEARDAYNNLCRN